MYGMKATKGVQGHKGVKTGRLEPSDLGTEAGRRHMKRAANKLRRSEARRDIAAWLEES